MSLVDLKVFRAYVHRAGKDFTDVPLRVLRDIYIIASVRYYSDDESDILDDATFDKLCKYLTTKIDEYRDTFPPQITKEGLVAGTGYSLIEDDLSSVQQSVLEKLRNEHT